MGHPVEKNPNSVMVTRIGTCITGALSERMMTSRNVLEGVTAALEQLHSNGFAHCDISINNIFYDNQGVFLGDLEYLTPLNDPPPHLTRISKNAQPETALQLDELQFQLLQREFILYR